MQSKRKGLFRSVLALLTTLTMLLGMMPMTAFAADSIGGSGSETVGESNMHLSKTATLENDGTYTIKLEAYATGETTTTIEEEAVPLDIVLVLDQSGSMLGGFGNEYTAYNANYKADDIDGKNYYYYKEDENKYYKVYKNGSGIYYTNNAGAMTRISKKGIYSGNLYMPNKTKLEKLTESVNGFVSSIKDNALQNNVQHRIAIVGFAHHDDDTSHGLNTEILSIQNEDGTIGTWFGKFISYNGGEGNYFAYSDTDEAATFYSQALKDVTDTDEEDILNRAIEALDANGATRSDLGMFMAKGILNSNSDSERKQVVVMFTDGDPTASVTSFDSNEETLQQTIDIANKTIEYSNNIKQSATVYTVGVLDGADPSNTTTNRNKYMHAVSSNFPDAESLTNLGNGDNKGYYLTASSAEGLENVFTSISQTITESTTTVTLDEKSVMKDILSDNFILPDAYNASSNITVETVKGSMDDAGNISWKKESIAGDNITATVSNNNTINVTGFDYSEEYIAKGHEGKKLVVTIKGVLPKDSAVTGEAIYTNSENSGIYAEGTTAPAYKFPKPQTILTSKAYVLDYAKPVTLSSSDWNMNSVSAVAKTNDARTIVQEEGNVDSLTLTNGKFAKNGLTYTPTTTSWDGYDTFYAFGTTEDSEIKEVDANANGNLWSRVNVLPANNVYYEDDFITSKESGIVGIEYSGDWKVVNNVDQEIAGANTETPNTEIHGGWKNADLADDTKYSDGSAHEVNASEKNASATFTFTGTGVDIYSRTNTGVGMVTAIVKDTSTGTTVAIKFMDNKSDSGDYYQIPTLSFGPDELKGSKTYEDGELTGYGTYEVTLIVSPVSDENTENGKRSMYYLDGIRVYNPIANDKVDEVVEGAYGNAMLNATFQEVRDILLDLSSGGAELANSSVVFLDKVDDETNVVSSDVSAFKEYGPKNEVYLGKNQKIAFSVEASETTKYFIGLKALNGETTAKITNGDKVSPIKISHSTDLYYEISPSSLDDYKGCIAIENAGEGLLSITKIFYNGQTGAITTLSADEKLSDTNEVAATYSTDLQDQVFSDSSEFMDGTDVASSEFSDSEGVEVFAAQAEEAPLENTTIEETSNILQNPLVVRLVEYANLFDTLPEVPYEKEVVEDKTDSVEGDNEEVKDDNNDETVKDPEEGNVEITNPEPEEEQKPIKNIYDWLNQLFHGFGKYF